MERVLIPVVAFGPIVVTLVILWFVPGALAWAARSWGVLAAIVLAIIEFVILATSSELKDAALVAVYDENLPKFRKNLSSWQEKELGPFRAAWGKHLAANLDAAVEAGEDGASDDDDEMEADEDDGPGTGDSDRPPAHLEFDILEAHKDKATIATPPYFAPAGQWAVVKCRTRTEPTATFWFAETSPPLSGEQPFAFGEARIWTESEDDWRDLVARSSPRSNPGRARTRPGRLPDPSTSGQPCFPARLPRSRVAGSAEPAPGPRPSGLPKTGQSSFSTGASRAVSAISPRRTKATRMESARPSELISSQPSEARDGLLRPP
jgi:hypothetical protein